MRAMFMLCLLLDSSSCNGHCDMDRHSSCRKRAWRGPHGRRRPGRQCRFAPGPRLQRLAFADAEMDVLNEVEFDWGLAMVNP